MNTSNNPTRELTQEFPLPSFLDYVPNGRYKTKLVDMPKNLKPKPIRKKKRGNGRFSLLGNTFKEFIRGFVVTGLVMFNIAAIAVAVFFFGFLFTIVSPEEVASLYGETAIEVVEERSLIEDFEWVWQDGDEPEAIAVSE